MQLSLPSCPDFADALLARHDEICDLLVPQLESTPGQADAERRQFVAAFVQLVGQAARGDYGLRDEYLETIIPACKAAGFDFGYMLSVLVHIFMALMPFADTAPKGQFLTAFARDYTKRLVAVWQRS